MKILLVRCKPDGTEREDQFLEGIISIGWPTKESLKDKSRSELENIIKKNNYDPSPLHITQIFNFITLPKGSVVLTPSIRNRDIHIFKTVTAYIHDPVRVEDGNPHTIRGEFIRTVSREMFSDQLQQSLKAARKTVSDLTKYSNEILKFLKNYSKEDELSFDADKESKEVMIGFCKDVYKLIPNMPEWMDIINKAAKMGAIDTMAQAFKDIAKEIQNDH